MAFPSKKDQRGHFFIPRCVCISKKGGRVWVCILAWGRSSRWRVSRWWGCCRWKWSSRRGSRAGSCSGGSRGRSCAAPCPCSSAPVARCWSLVGCSPRACRRRLRCYHHWRRGSPPFHCGLQKIIMLYARRGDYFAGWKFFSRRWWCSGLSAAKFTGRWFLPSDSERRKDLLFYKRVFVMDVVVNVLLEFTSSVLDHLLIQGEKFFV